MLHPCHGWYQTVPQLLYRTHICSGASQKHCSCQSACPALAVLLDTGQWHLMSPAQAEYAPPSTSSARCVSEGDRNPSVLLQRQAA